MAQQSCESKETQLTAPKIFVIKEVLDNVIAYDRELYNTNNLWGNEGKPTDYAKTLARFHTRNWVRAFHAESDFWSIVIEPKHVGWMRRAANVGMIRAGFPRALFEDEMSSFLAEPLIRQADKRLEASGQRWFVRSEEVSLKRGVHGAGPFASMRQVVEGLCTCEPTHTPIPHETEEGAAITLYFLPWRTMKDLREFRVFVHDNTITAISQQACYSLNDWLRVKSRDEIVQLAQGILAFFAKNIREPMSALSKDYTFDLALLDDDSFYFIEPNSFGAKLAAGASLFHWTHDQTKLTNKDNQVFLKYVHCA